MAAKLLNDTSSCCQLTVSAHWPCSIATWDWVKWKLNDNKGFCSEQWLYCLSNENRKHFFAGTFFFSSKFLSLIAFVLLWLLTLFWYFHHFVFDQEVPDLSRSRNLDLGKQCRTSKGRMPGDKKNCKIYYCNGVTHWQSEITWIFHPFPTKYPSNSKPFLHFSFTFC